MNFSNIDYGSSSCETKNILNTDEIKSVGIFEQTKETDEVLNEIMRMLDTFKRAIRNYPVPNDEKAIEACCFRDAVTIVNEKAHAIKGDLERIINEFR